MESVHLNNLIWNNVNTAGLQTNVKSGKIITSLVTEVIIIITSASPGVGFGVFWRISVCTISLIRSFTIS